MPDDTAPASPPPDVYRVVEGEIIKVSDGDTVDFVVRDPASLKDLPEHDYTPDGSGGYYRLRIQGIDTPELHYPPNRSCFVEEAAKRRGISLCDLPSVMYAQPQGDEAGKLLAKLTGLDDKDVHYVPAFVLTRGPDLYGRLISYVVLAEQVDGLVDNTNLVVDDDLLKRTLNYQMLAQGMAYYTGYKRMPEPHRNLFVATAKKARGDGIGIWAVDPDPLAAFTLIDEGSLAPSGQLILPKLFRRCISYLFAVNADDYRGDFHSWMQKSAACQGASGDMVLVRGEAAPRAFDTLIECNGQTIKLLADPVDMVFQEATENPDPAPTG